MRIDRSWYERPQGVASHVSCGGVIARRDGAVALIALITEPGIDDGYVLPKGHREPGETLEQAARREIAEEAGIVDLVLVQQLGVCERLDLMKRGWKITHYYLFTTEHAESSPADGGREHGVGWFALDAVPPMFWPEQRDLIERSATLIRRALGT